MHKLDKYCQRGNYSDNQVIAEDKEYYKDIYGNIQKLQGYPDHDDYTLVDENGDYIQDMPYNKGGVLLNDVDSVLSATHENRSPEERSYTQQDAAIRIKKKEGSQLANDLGFKIKFNGGSPSKLLDKIYDSKQSQLKKYDIIYNRSLLSHNSHQANQDFIDSLPTDEDIYDTVFDLQESKKLFIDNTNKAQQGKGKLQIYPSMMGNRPVALVNLKNKVIPVEVVNGRTVSMDDMFSQDSVVVKGNKAITFKKNKK